MKLGVVSDTHNNLKNITHLISLFNYAEVDCVVHTGDITNEKSLAKFKDLESEFYCVYGNNDRTEKGLQDVAIQEGFKLKEPPLVINVDNRSIAIFHEPDYINEFISRNKEVDIILHGHTHRYREEILDKVLIFNPGESAGMLKGKNAIGIIDLRDLSVQRVFF